MMITDATDLPRLTQCVASYGMPGYSPTPGMPTEYQLEGDAAHWLASSALKGEISIDDYIDRKAPNGHWIDATMADHVETYVSKVRTRYGTRHIETPITLQLTDNIVINCRPDVITDEIGNGYRYVWIDDFKYGWRIVEAENNVTMLAYAIAYSRSRVFGPETLFMLTVHQPRPHHDDGKIRTWCFGILELRTLERQLIERLSTPTPMLQTGPSCYRCPAMTNCPAYQKALYSVFDFADAPLPHNLTPDLMSELRDQVKAAIAKLENYDDALEERITDTIKRGTPVRNYVLEPATGPLEWNSGITVDVLKMMKPGAVVSTEKPRTPTQLKKLFGDDVIAALATRPNKGLQLVRRDMQKHAEKLFGNKTGD